MAKSLSIVVGKELLLSEQFRAHRHVGHAVEYGLSSDPDENGRYRVYDQVHDQVRARLFSESHGEWFFFVHGEGARAEAGFRIGDAALVQFAVYHRSEVAAREDASHFPRAPLVV